MGVNHRSCADAHPVADGYVLCGIDQALWTDVAFSAYLKAPISINQVKAADFAVSPNNDVPIATNHREWLYDREVAQFDFAAEDG
jgi:hypothetical protein